MNCLLGWKTCDIARDRVALCDDNLVNEFDDPLATIRALEFPWGHFMLTFRVILTRVNSKTSLPVSLDHPIGQARNRSSVVDEKPQVPFSLRPDIATLNNRTPPSQIGGAFGSPDRSRRDGTTPARVLSPLVGAGIYVMLRRL